MCTVKLSERVGYELSPDKQRRACQNHTGTKTCLKSVPCVVAHSFNSRTFKAEAGGSLSRMVYADGSRPAGAT